MNERWEDASLEQRLDWLREDLVALSKGHQRAVSRLDRLVDELTSRLSALERSRDRS